MADQTANETEVKPGWWERVKTRATAMRKTLMDYLPAGIISAVVMVGGASLVAQSGMLGGVGDWIGKSMGAADFASGAIKVARIVGIGVLINGVVGLAKNSHMPDSHHTAAGTQTASARVKADASPELAMQQSYEQEFENPNQSLPRMTNPRGGISQPQIMS